jgi:hypothetical protein
VALHTKAGDVYVIKRVDARTSMVLREDEDSLGKEPGINGDHVLDVGEFTVLEPGSNMAF